MAIGSKPNRLIFFCKDDVPLVVKIGGVSWVGLSGLFAIGVKGW
jgi:hypothetical protein